ncbi:MAG: hypothetical protein ACRELS_03485 [Candidatus Rokuibacteriota bacterium]
MIRNSETLLAEHYTWMVGDLETGVGHPGRTGSVLEKHLENPLAG